MTNENSRKVSKPLETVLKKGVLLKRAKFKRYHYRMMVLTNCFLKWTRRDGGKVRGSMSLCDIEEAYIVTEGQCKFDIIVKDGIIRWSADTPTEAVEWVTAVEVLIMYLYAYI